MYYIIFKLAKQQKDNRKKWGNMDCYCWVLCDIKCIQTESMRGRTLSFEIRRKTATVPWHFTFSNKMQGRATLSEAEILIQEQLQK